MKNLFFTSTVRNILLLFCLAVYKPTISAIYQQKLSEIDCINLVGAILVCLQGIESRYKASEDVYTPKFLPGRNKE